MPRDPLDPLPRPRVRIALLGCGRVAQRYRELLAGALAAEAELVAVCDRRPERMAPFAAQFGCAAVSEMAGLAGQAPDLVCVLTESGNHAGHAIALLEAGLSVLVEKPVCLRPDDAARMAQAAARAGGLLGVVKQNRFNAPLRFLRAAIDGGRFGRTVLGSVRVHWCRRQPYYEDGWHGTWRLDGGVLAQQAIHHLDALQWLMGPVAAVCAHGAARVNRLEAEDTAVAVLRFASGAMGTIEATTAARPQDHEAALTIVGEGAYARVGGVGLNRLEAWEPASRETSDDAACAVHSELVRDGYGNGHLGCLRAMLAAVRARDPALVPVSVAEAAKSLQLLHALYASMERGTWVTLAERAHSARLGIDPAAPETAPDHRPAYMEG